MNLCNTRTVRALMAEYGLSFKKEFGQNFLISPDVPQNIADSCCDNPDSGILEIGPGIGTLTVELCERFSRVRAVEIDRRMIPVLKETLSDYDHVEVINADFLTLQLRTFLDEQFPEMPVSVCANLPYYITTPILMKLLEEAADRIDTITIMVQAEVAARLTAKPGSSEYGAVTAAVAYRGTARRLFTVPAGCFIPQPKVNSAVVRIDLYKERPYVPADEQFLFTVIRGAFGQRRKTLANALASALPGFDKATIQHTVAACGFPENIRGERLSIADFCTLADALYIGNAK